MHAPSSHGSFGNAQAQDRGASHIAPDCAGQNFYAIDRGLRDLVRLYLEPDDFGRLEPHFDRLGVLAGGRLDELARVADKYPPLLNARDRFGRDEDWIDYHWSYREMEQIAFGDFQFHAMSHRAGTLGMDRPLPAVAKYALQYLFVQAEFGLMCPISVTDTSIHLIRKFASAELKDYLLPKMLSGDVATMWKGTQFMTERAGGSDVGAIETIARCEDGEWRLYGDKWFCSHADADVALLLARPEGAPDGTKGLALFALPRRLKDGRRNAYRIVRLKDKLGTRSMASGEIVLEGAVAYLVGVGRRLEVLSIIKRRGALGLLAHSDEEERLTRTKTELEAGIAIALGGLAAEEMCFGESGTGPGADLAAATSLAAQMVGSFGMAGSLISYEAVADGPLSRSNLVGKVLANPETKQRVEDILTGQRERVREVLAENRDIHAALREALLEHDELVRDEILEVIEKALANRL